MDLEGLLVAWRVNNLVNFKLLELVPNEAFEAKPGKGKTIRSNFTHIVGVRKMWCEELVKKQGGDFPTLDWKTATRDEISAALESSSGWMEKLFASRATKDGIEVFFAYCVAHEAHHRSQVEISLRMAGIELDDKSAYGLWEWAKFAKSL